MTTEQRNNLINSIADCVSSPGEFLTKIMAIDGIGDPDLAKKLNTSVAYINMVTSNYNIIGTKAAYRFAKALDINPFVLNRLGADYRMRECIEQKELESIISSKLPANRKKTKQLVGSLIDIAVRKNKQKKNGLIH